jgi:hypothetical protein
VLVLIALHDTKWLDGAINVPGVDGGKVLRQMPESPQNLPQIHPKFAPWCGPSSTGARCSANIKYSMEAHGKVRWDGTFDCPLTPSIAQDMADRVVGRQRIPIPLFCATAKRGGGRAGGSHQHVRGNITYGM